MGEISAFDDPLPGQLRIDASGTPSLTITAPAGTRPGADLPVTVVLGDTPLPEPGAGAGSGEGVVVRVRYRRGFAGFLPLPGDPPGHTRAVADAAAALAWVQGNAEGYGGDPTNVTLVGAGEAAAVGLWLCRRDHYKGEFRRARLSQPVFARTPVARRRWLARAVLAAPLTRDRLDALAREHPARVERAYRRYVFYTRGEGFGPAPFDDAELAPLAEVELR